MLELYPDASPLHRLLAELYQDVLANPLPRRECWVSMILQHAYDPFSPLSDAIAVVESHGQLGTLKKRLRLLHGDGKKHSRDDHDRNVQGALAEAFGFAWTVGQGCEHATIQANETATPDIRIATNDWMEVKAVHLSQVELQNVRRSLDTGKTWGGVVSELAPGFFNKLDCAFSNAIGKFESVSAGGRLLFMLVNLEVNQLPRLSDCHEEIADWARNKRAAHPSVGLVIQHMQAWAEPMPPIVELFDPTWTSAVI